MAKQKDLLNPNYSIDPKTGLVGVDKETGLEIFGTNFSNTYKSIESTPTEGFDKSKYDPYFNDQPVVTGESVDLDDQRAQRQHGTEKLRNGFVKMLGTAGTTAIDGFLGTAAGLVNLAQGENYSDNAVTRKMVEWQQKMEEVLPNYYTKEETQSENPLKGFLPGTTGSANFWGDKFMKNMGFTIGMALDGAIVGGLLSSALGTSRIASQIGKFIVNSADEGGASLSEMATLVKGLKAGTVDVSKFEKAIQLGAQSVRRKTLATQLGASVFSSQAEARFEAINQMDQTRKEQTAKMESELANNYNSMIASGYSPEKAQGIINNEKVRRTKEIDDISEAAGNAVFGMNMALLSATNFIQFKDAFSNGFTFNRKNVAAFAKGKTNAGNTADAIGSKIVGEFGEYSAKTGKLAKAGRIGKGLANAGTEGFEEGAQQTIQSGSDKYYSAKLNPDSKKDAVDLVDAFAYGMQQGFGTKMGLEQVFIGALTGALGVPTVGGRRGVQWAGGIAGDIRNEFQNSKQAKALAEQMNSAAAHITSQKAKDDAVLRGDKYDYENANDMQFFNTVTTFAKAGKLNDLIEQLDSYGSAKGDDIRKMMVTKDEQGNEVDPNVNKTDEQLEQEARKKISKLKEKALHVAEIRESIKTLFPGASDAVLDEMSFTSSSINDIKNRINSLSTEIAQTSGITVTPSELKNSEVKSQVTKDINQFVEDNPTEADVKTKYADLQKLITRRDKFVDSYKNLVTPEGQTKLEDKIAKEEKKVKVEESKKTLTPFKSKIIQDTESGERFVVTKNDKTDEVTFTPVDEFGKHRKGETTTVDFETFDSPEFQSKFKEVTPTRKPKVSPASEIDAEIQAQIDREDAAKKAKKTKKKTETVEESEASTEENPFIGAGSEVDESSMPTVVEPTEEEIETEESIEERRKADKNFVHDYLLSHIAPEYIPLESLKDVKHPTQSVANSWIDRFYNEKLRDLKASIIEEVEPELEENTSKSLYDAFQEYEESQEEESEEVTESVETESEVEEATPPKELDLDTLEMGSTLMNKRTANTLFKYLTGSQTLFGKLIRSITPYRDKSKVKKVYAFNDNEDTKRYYKWVTGTKIQGQGYKGQIFTGEELYGSERWKKEQARIVEEIVETLTPEELKKTTKEKVRQKVEQSLPNTLFVVMTKDGKFVTESGVEASFDVSKAIFTTLPNPEAENFKGTPKYNTRTEDKANVDSKVAEYKQTHDIIVESKRNGETVSVIIDGKNQGFQNFGLQTNNIKTALDNHETELRVNTSGISVTFSNGVQHTFSNPEQMTGRVVIRDKETDNTYIGDRNKLSEKVKLNLVNLFKFYINLKAASKTGNADFKLRNEKGAKIYFKKQNKEGKEEELPLSIFDMLKLYLGSNVVLNEDGEHSWFFITKEGFTDPETGSETSDDFINLKMPNGKYELMQVAHTVKLGRNNYVTTLHPDFESKFSEWLNNQYHTVLSNPLIENQGVRLLDSVNVEDGKAYVTMNDEFNITGGYNQYLTANTVNGESVQSAIVLQTHEGLKESYKDLPAEFSTTLKVNQNLEFHYAGREVPIVKEAPAIASESEVKKESKPLPTSRKINRKLYRSATSETRKEDISVTQLWFEKRFPGVDFHIVKQLIDGKNWGQFKDASVYIYENAGIGTTYHEAWHVVTHLFLTTKEVQSIYDEYAKENGIEKAEWFTKSGELTEAGHSIEEKLANDFMDWKLGKPITAFKSRKQRNFFNRIWDAIKEFFGFKGADIEEIFNRIESGYYADAKKVTGFSGNSNRVNPELGITESQSVALNNSLTSMVLSYIMDPEHPERAKSLFSKESNEDVRAGAYAEAKEIIESEIEQQRADGHNDQADVLQRVIDKWDVARKEHYSHLNAELGIEVIEDDNEVVQNENDKMQLRSESGIKRSVKDSTTNNMKLLISSLPNIFKDEDGEVSMFVNELGLQETCDFGFMFSLLGNKLAGSDRLVNLGNPSAMETRLADLRDNNSDIGPIIGVLMNRLKLLEHANIDETTSQLQQEFFQTFSRNYYDFYMDINSKNGKSERFNSTQNKLSNRIKDMWSNTISDTAKGSNSKFFVTSDDETLRYNSNAFKDEVRRVVSINTSNVFDFLYKLGVKFSNPGKVQKMLTDSNEMEKLVRTTTEVVGKIIKGQGERRSFPILFDANLDTGMSGNVNYLANLEARTNPDTFENSHFGINGEQQYNLGLNSYETLIVNAFNNVRNYAELLIKCPFLNSNDCAYLKNSLMLKPGGILFNADGSKNFNTIEYGFYDGSKGRTSKDAVEYRKLKAPDKLRTRLNTWFQDKAYFILRPGDSDLERTLEIKKNFISNSDIADRNFHEQFFSYLTDELNRGIQYKFDGVNIVNRSKNAFNGVFISLLLDNNSTNPSTKALQDNLEVLINQLNETTESEKATALVQEFLGRNDMQVAFQATIEEFMDDEVNVLYDEVVKNKLVTVSNGKIKNNGLAIDPKNIQTISDLKSELLNYVVNDKAWTIEQTKVFTGDPIQFKSLEDEFKRHSSFVSTKRTMNDDPHQHEIMDRHMKREDGRLHSETTYHGMGTITTATMAEEKGKAGSAFLKSVEKLLGKKSQAYQNFKSADGQGIISLDEYRWTLYKSGQWSFGKHSLEELYQWEIQKAKNPKATPIYTDWKGNTWEIKKQPDLKFKPQKLQYAGPLAESGYTNIVFKLSVYPLTPSLIAGNPELTNLNERMKKSQVGVVTFESGNKFGYKLNDKGKANTLRSTDDLLTQETYSKFWGIQVDSTPKVKDRVVTGTQMMKQILSNMFANGSFKSERLQKLAADYIEANDKRIELGMNNLRNKLDLKVEGDNYVVENIDSFKAFLLDAAKKRNFPDNILDGIDLMTAANGIDTLVHREKVENVLFALADATVISQKRHGNSAALASGVLIDESLKFYEEGDVINPNTKAEQIRIANFFKEFPELTVEDIRSMDPRLLHIIGFRIPTQAMSSIDAADVEGWLPSTMSDMVVKPKETVAKVGEDFDYDKFNQYFPNYYATQKRPVYIEYGTRKEMLASFEFYLRDVKSNNQMSFEEYQQKAIENHITELQRSILLDKDNRKSLLSPVDSQNLSSAAAYVTWVKSDKPELPTVDDDRNEIKEEDRLGYWYEKELDGAPLSSLLSYKFVTNIGTRFQTGSSAIGIGALFATFAIACQHNGVTLGHSNIRLAHNTKEGNVDLGGSETTTGLNISDLFNEWLTVFVDAAKEPHMVNLGVNMQNVNTALYLTQAGVDPKTIGLFLQQPIIQQYIAAQEVNESLVAKENKFEIEDKKKFIARVKLAFANGITYDEKTLVKKNFTDDDLEKMILNPKPTTSSDVLHQMQVLNDFLEYQQQSRKVSEAMQAINMDTNGGGKNVSELLYKLRLVDKLSQEEEIPPEKEYFNKKGEITKVVRYPYIVGFSKIMGTKWENGNAVPDESKKSFLSPYFKAVFELKKIYEPFVRVLRDPQVIAIMDSWIDVLSTKGTSKDEIIKVMDSIKQDLFSYLVNTKEFVVDGVTFNLVKDKQSLFYGENNIASELKKAKAKDKENLFLKRLTPVFPRMKKYRGSNVNTAVQIKYYSSKTEKIEQNAIVADFYKLRNTNPAFYYRLIKACILQTGLKNSPMSFWQVIPAETFNQIMTEVLKQDNIETANRNNFSEQVILQNSRNSNMVPSKPTEGFQFYAEAPEVDEEGLTQQRVLPIQVIKERTEDELLTVSPEFIPVNDLKENMMLQSWQNIGIIYSKRTKLTKVQKAEVDMSAEDASTEDPFEGVSSDVEETTEIPRNEDKNVVPLQTGMQTTLDLDVKQTTPLFKEHGSTKYADRTRINASADATIAIAVDFTSAGEKATKSSVENQKKKYIPVEIKLGNPFESLLTEEDPFSKSKLVLNDKRIFELAEKIVDQLNNVNAKTLNIAGNGIYTMKSSGITQKLADEFAERLLEYVIYSDNLKTQITSIRSGGQTGFDEAGIKAGMKLGIPTIILAPKGWKFRNINGQDISDEKQFKERFENNTPFAQQEKSTDLGMSVGDYMKTLSKEGRNKLRQLIESKDVQFKCK